MAGSSGSLSLDKASYTWGETIQFTWSADPAPRSFPWLRGSCLQDGEVTLAWNVELALYPDYAQFLGDVGGWTVDETKPASGTAVLYVISWRGHEIIGQQDLATVEFAVTI